MFTVGGDSITRGSKDGRRSSLVGSAIQQGPLSWPWLPPVVHAEGS